ncbi:GAF and ANTAR domain-containing protein [Nakamurella flavida]|uniref:GAF and ANTAR domain-containing protein n=1 Tax=Nakamurella flavida TaxID=363630 RepID=A0A939BYX9_9ACTN|nr:GAF and ANTAR domain-containing protein [Nakamurella flavida]MBM9475153.1 GAF and ANTAR domain-containing protein [Nakamurella flavida]MDP9776722.1 GAF domain-containing protein [Nakamurella flavida]
MMSSTARDFSVRVLQSTQSAVGDTGTTDVTGIADLLDIALGCGVADYAGVCEQDPHLPGSFTTVAPTHHLVRAADRQQLHNQHGPYRQTRSQLGVLTSPDVAADARWPLWGPAAAALGIGSVMSVALRGRRTFGAVTFYTATPRPPTADQIAQAAVIATSISIVLASRPVRALITSPRSRDQIGQAQGILMQQHQLTADEALDMLRRLCHDDNRTLADLAGSVVDGWAS